MLPNSFATAPAQTVRRTAPTHTLPTHTPMASPVPACVSAVFDERLSKMLILVKSPEHIAAN
eukprot:1524141-Pleurochrysis_carterae.AAC.1